jgi:hypothetical protein
VVSGWQAFCEDEDVCLAACLLLRSTLVGDNEARRLQVRRVLNQRDIDCLMCSIRMSLMAPRLADR